MVDSNRTNKNYLINITDRSGFHDTAALWLPFQTAAGTVTTLYKGKL